MTDKELAEKYEEKIDYIEVNDDGKRIFDSIDIQQAYLAGLKDGRKEKWHDLRENPKYPIMHDKENDEWHYIKDGILPNVKFGRVDVTIAYTNAYGNPCKMDCCFNGSNFVYWDDRKPIGWKKVDIFGKIYAWKYPEKLPEPPKENKE